MSPSISHFIFHSVLKTYFPWSKWRKSIDGVRNVPHFKDDRFLKLSTRSFTLSGDVWQQTRIFVRVCSWAFYYIYEVKPGIWQSMTKLWMCLTGKGVCWRQHLLCMIMKWKTIFHSGLDNCLSCDLLQSVTFLGNCFNRGVVGYDSKV